MGDFVSFRLLKELTGIQSASNLASHLRALEGLELVEYHQAQAGRRNLAFYEITTKGREELHAADEFLRMVLDGLKRHER